MTAGRSSPTARTAARDGPQVVERLLDEAREAALRRLLHANRWPAVHRSDAARVFRLAFDAAPPGAIYHAVAEEGVSTRAVAESTGRHLGLPVESITPDDAITHFGWIGLMWSIDVPTSSALTRAQLGWQPTGPGLLDDLEAGHYFETA